MDKNTIYILQKTERYNHVTQVSIPAKRFKITPDETLQVAQDLYEKKLTTYPRTDARVLTTAVAKEIGKITISPSPHTSTAGIYPNISESRVRSPCLTLSKDFHFLMTRFS